MPCFCLRTLHSFAQACLGARLCVEHPMRHLKGNAQFVVSGCPNEATLRLSLGDMNDLIL